MENTEPIGLVSDFPTAADAWKEADRLGLRVRINADAGPGRIKLAALAEHYLQADFGEDAIRPKSVNTIPIVEHYVRDYIVKRWGDMIAEDVKPIEVQRWLKSLNTDWELAWATVSKIRGLFHRIYKIGILHELVEKNPIEAVETRCKSDYRAIVHTPEQTLAILKSLKSVLHHALVLTCAGTALRASEILSLRWSDVLWAENRIRVSKRWAKGEDGGTKTEASDGYVPLHPIIASHLKAWQCATPHAKPADFVFPSLRENGRIPLCASVFVRNYLRPAAKSAGVSIALGQRFGLHNLRHSLSTWLISKAKTDPKTVQGLLRHSKIQTTLDLYTQADGDEARAAQGRYLEAVGLTEAIQ